MNTDIIKSLERVKRKLKTEARGYGYWASKASSDGREAWKLGENALLCAVKFVEEEIARQRSGNREAK